MEVRVSEGRKAQMLGERRRARDKLVACRRQQDRAGAIKAAEYLNILNREIREITKVVPDRVF